MNSYYFTITICFNEYLPEDGRKRPRHIGGLPHVCILLYLIIVQLLEYIWRLVVSCYILYVCMLTELLKTYSIVDGTVLFNLLYST